MWRGENFWSAGVKKNYTLPSVCFWHSAKSLFAECCICTLGKELTAAGWFNGGPKFAECETLTLGKESLCRVAYLSTRQRARLCRVPILSTRQRPALPRVVSLSSVRVWALGKDILCRVPDIKYSAKFLALVKACVSGSAWYWVFFLSFARRFILLNLELIIFRLFRPTL